MRQPPPSPYGFMPPQGHPPPQKDHSWLIALLVGGAVLVVLIPILIFAAVFLVQPSSTSNVATPIVAAFSPLSTSVAEGTPLPTSTPAPFGIVDATFGGLPSAFTARYGNPASSGSYTFTIGSHTVHMTLKTSKGTDGYKHVSQVVLTFIAKGFSASDTAQLITPLLPSDADGRVTNGDATHYTIEFTSDAVAEVFLDSGDFHILCALVDSQTQRSTCTYALGH